MFIQELGHYVLAELSNGDGARLPNHEIGINKALLYELGQVIDVLFNHFHAGLTIRNLS